MIYFLKYFRYDCSIPTIYGNFVIHDKCKTLSAFTQTFNEKSMLSK